MQVLSLSRRCFACASSQSLASTSFALFRVQLAWTIDARKQKYRDFNTLVLICKHDGLEHLWQSRKWVFPHAEVRGKDNKKNIEADLLPAMQEVQVRCCQVRTSVSQLYVPSPSGGL
jgi:hypothetical protein